MVPRRWLLSGLALVGSLPAQGVWVVDRDQRPGTTHSDIPAAVAAAAPGDFVIVRFPWTTTQPYTAPTLTKGLAILGEEAGSSHVPGMAGTLTIQGIAAGETVVVSSFYMGDWMSPTGCGIRAYRNPGTLVLVNFTLEMEPVVFGATPAVAEFRLTDCDDVRIQGCSLNATPPGNVLVRSRVRALDSSFQSQYRWQFPVSGNVILPGGTALELEDSIAELTRCRAMASAGVHEGSCPGPFRLVYPGGPALRLDASSRVEAGAGCVFVGEWRTTEHCPAPPRTRYGTVADGAGTLVADPACSLTGVVRCQHVQASLYETRIGLARIFDPVDIDVVGEPHAFALVAIGFPWTTPQTTSFGELWLDPAVSPVLGSALLDAEGKAAFSLPVVPGFPLAGILGAQSALLLANNTITLTRPAFATILPPCW